jgi:predicted RNA-binding Zn ribbon-like protein
MDHDIWIDLLNSDWHDHKGTGAREDRLEDPGWLENYICRLELDLEDVSREHIRRGFRKLRNVLRGIVDRIVSRKKITEADWSNLNRYLERVSYVRKVRGRETKVEIVETPVGDKMDAAMAALAMSFAKTILQEDLARLKVCENKDCRWVFMDASRNKSRRWCEDTCGNLMKVRRYRDRHKKKTGSGASTKNEPLRKKNSPKA